MKHVMEMPSRNGTAGKKRRLCVAAYCRVSTQHEEQDSSLELQMLHYEKEIARHPEWVNAGVFSDRSSGLKKQRKTQFSAMMKKCRAGKIDLILTKSISRFGRNILTSLKALQELESLGVDVFFEKDNLWLHEKEMQTMITMFLAIAQSESESMSQNIKWGIRHGFRNGTSGYAGFACFGYDNNGTGNLRINDAQAKIVRQIFQMRASGHSLGSISDWLHENAILSPTGKERWSRESIRKLLRNGKYIGDVLLQKTFVKDIFSGTQEKNKGELDQVLIQNHHPAIVSRELFDRANSKE